jgi:hypothetical protein
MTFAPPILPQLPGHEPEKVTVTLSSLNDTLNVLIPDSDEIPPDWTVYLILGADAEYPEWDSHDVPTGIWDDPIDDAITTRKGIELEIPKAELEKYKNRAVELRYKFLDESSFEPCSEPLLLHIEA